MGRLGRLNEAEREFSRLLELKPDHPFAHYGLARILVSRGNMDEGIAQYSEALKIKPDIAADQAFFQLLKNGGATDSHISQAISLARQAAKRVRASGNVDLARRIEKQTMDYR